MTRIGELSGLDVTLKALNAARMELWTDPSASRHWKKYLILARGLGKVAEAVSDTRRILAHSPNAVFNVLTVVSAALNDVPETAESLLQEMLKIRPHEPRFLQLLGVARYKCGDPMGAIGPLRQACLAEPKNENFWYALGKALSSIDPAEADAAYHHVLAINPHHKAQAARKALFTSGRFEVE
jgi:predicted Zn-dependent protease